MLLTPVFMFKLFAAGLISAALDSTGKGSASKGEGGVSNIIFFFASVGVTLFFIDIPNRILYQSAAEKAVMFRLVQGLAYTFLIAYWYRFFTYQKNEPQGPINFLESAKPSDDNVYIGVTTDSKRKKVALTWRDINHHVHVLGQPGSGKSVLLKNIYASQIRSGHGLLMLDLKADVDVKEDFIALCAHANRSEDLLLIDLSNPGDSFGYNPLLIGNATELKDKIVGAIEWSEPYYKKVSERVLLTLLRGFVHLRDEQGMSPTLEDLGASLSSVQGLGFLYDKVTDEAIKLDLNNLIAGFSRDFVKDLEGLKTDIALLVQSEFGAIFSKPDSLDMRKIIQERKVVLVNLDGQTYSESAKRFGRLLLADLRSASGNIVTTTTREERPKFTVIIDEFADVVSTDDMAKTFVGFLNRCRGSGIGVVIAHQSLGDFKDQSVKVQIMDSTETLFSFVQKDPETAETLASIVGTSEKWQHTEQTKKSLLFDDATGMGTRKLVQEYIYHPNVFKNLGTGMAVYAAKKPSRHGIVKVHMLEIPRLAKAQAAKKSAPPVATNTAWAMDGFVSAEKPKDSFTKGLTARELLRQGGLRDEDTEPTTRPGGQRLEI